MTVFQSDAVRNAKQDAFETTVGPSPQLRLYNGAIPADESTALSGNTLLAQGSLPSDWLTNAAAGVKSKSGVWTLTGQAGAGAGTAATFYRIYDSTGTTCHEQGSFTASGGGGDMTADNNSVANGQSLTVSTFQRTSAH